MIITHMKKLAALLILTAIAGCSDENSEIRGQFISGCAQGGAPKSICACTFEKLEEKYTHQELNELSDPYKKPPDGVMKYVIQSTLACHK